MYKMMALAALAAAAGSAQAGVTYNDSSNDLFDNSLAHMDILSVVVDHDATNLYFTLNLRGDVDATNWAKYCIGIDAAGGNNSVGNGWGRNVSWGANRIDYWVGTWVDEGGSNFGGELRSMDNAANNDSTVLAATYGGPGITGTATGFQVTMTLSRATLGLTGNDTFWFDVLSTGGLGSPPGVDHLSRSDQATPGWGDTSTSGNFLSYTIPAPGSAALVGLAGLMVGRRRR